MRKITKRSAAITAATVLAIGGGAAWAASGWFNGSGNVSASSSTIQPVVANINGVANLWPGKAVNASVSIGNYNEYSVNANDIDRSTIVVKVFDTAAAAANNTESATCTPAEAGINLGNVPATTVGPSGWQETTFTNFVGMESTASADCAGKVFKVTFKLLGDVVPS
jgi:hypothetical protein